MYKYIESDQNKNFKKCKSLQMKKYREKEGQFLAEGIKLAREAVDEGLCEKIILREGSEFHGFDEKVIFAEELFDSLTSMERSEGVIALCRIPEAEEFTDKILYLDEIRDPGNMGTMIRTAEAFGYSVLVSENSTDPFNDKALRGAMGSTFRVPLRMSGNREDLKKLKDEGYAVYSADFGGTDIRTVAPEKRHILIVGSESHGVGEELTPLIDKTFTIPMEGRGDSLNAAISAAISMYQLSAKNC